MTEPCAQEEVIKALSESQAKLDVKVDMVLENQHDLGTTIKQALDRLTSIIEADIGTRKDVEQGKKERELLFQKVRKIEGRTDAIEIRNAKCDGAGIFENFPKVWNWYQQEKGIRRFIPATAAFICACLVIWDKI